MTAMLRTRPALKAVDATTTAAAFDPELGSLADIVALLEEAGMPSFRGNFTQFEDSALDEDNPGTDADRTVDVDYDEYPSDLFDKIAA